MATSSSRIANSAGELEARSSSNSSTFISPETGNVYAPGQLVSFDGYFADDVKVDDELDFFTLADDKARSEKVIAWRELHNRGIVASWTTVGVGAGLVGAGVALLFGSGASEEQVTASLATPLGQGAMGAMAVGGIVIASSFYAYALLGPSEPVRTDGGYELVLSTSEGSDAALNHNLRKHAVAEPTPAAD